MTVLVFGGNGQVGRELLRALVPLGGIVAATRSGRLFDGRTCETADLDQPDSLPALLDRLQPRIVVNAAAYTAVDRAEQEPELAFRANAEAPAAIARWCAVHGVQMVHYSTDYVFDGRGKRPYREDDATGPLGVYGASKREGEEAIIASGARHMIFRTAWVYASHGRNFLQTMLRLGAERERLGVVADQVGTPTPAAMIADVTAQVLRSGASRSGLWHLTASGRTSWHGFAEAIFERAVATGLLARMPQVDALESSQYPTAASRPSWSCLDNHRLQEDFGIVPPAWQEGLDRVIAELAAADRNR